MEHKKGQGRMIKHAEFMSDNGFEEMSPLSGFSIINDSNSIDYDKAKTNFRSDFFTILLVHQGSLKGSLNLEEYNMTKNSLLIIPQNTVKKLISVNKDCIVSGLSFTMDFLMNIGMQTAKTELYEYFGTKYSPLWQLTEDDALIVAEQFKQLAYRANNMSSNIYGKELLYHNFFLLVYELSAMSARYVAVKNTNVSRKESLVISFTNLVQVQFKQHRNLQQYAEQLFVTAKYLTETVKELTGKNAGEVIDDFVMLEAKLLLDDPKLSIAQVAEQLHFSDQSFFGKFFKRHSGYSPKEFRAISK